MLGKMPEGWENGCPLGANTDYLVYRDKQDSFMKENTALLKSTHIEEATRKPKCMEETWQEGSVLPSGSLLKSFLNVP